MQDNFDGSWFFNEPKAVKHCEECGKKISAKRLKILPNTRTCVTHSVTRTEPRMVGNNLVMVPVGAKIRV